MIKVSEIKNEGVYILKTNLTLFYFSWFWESPTWSVTSERRHNKRRISRLKL
jgi:hypothetical protein